MTVAPLFNRKRVLVGGFLSAGFVLADCLVFYSGLLAI